MHFYYFIHSFKAKPAEVQRKFTYYIAEQRVFFYILQLQKSFISYQYYNILDITPITRSGHGDAAGPRVQTGRSGRPKNP